MSNINFYNTDCVQFMKTKPDKCYDLAVVDPPYGIGEDGGKCRTRGSKKTNGAKKNWDNKKPTTDYFKELQRVSKNQIIFGGNYFANLLPASRCWIYWQKNMGGDFADGELAWTSFDKVLKQYTKRSETFNRIHPTQKPVDLYRWILQRYAENTMKILDTHGGSMTNAIACEIEGFDLDICEIDKEYFDLGVKAFNLHKSQTRIF